MKTKHCFSIMVLLLFFLINEKTNAQSPDWLWAKSIGGTNDEHVGSIAIDALGNVYTTGEFNGTVDFDPGMGVFNLTSAGFSDIFISKLEGSGNFVWAKSMGGPSYDFVATIAIDLPGSGDIYTTGSFLGTADFDPGPGTFNLSASPGYFDSVTQKLIIQK